MISKRADVNYDFHFPDGILWSYAAQQLITSQIATGVWIAGKHGFQHGNFLVPQPRDW